MKKRQKPKVIKQAYYQTGKLSAPSDRLFRAMKPGKRRSKSGKVYWETRHNRSDL